MLVAPHARQHHAAIQTLKLMLMLGATFLATACGGGGEQVEPTPVQYTVGGTVSGLAGAGLTLSLDPGSEVQVSAGATSFTFPGTVNSGTSFNVSIKTQPSNPTQTCTLSGRSGTVTANVTTVGVSCTTNTFALGGTISGLTGSGLTLLLNGASPLTIAAGSAGFSFPAIASGSSYAVTVGTQPTASGQGAPQTCTVTNGSGVVGGTSIASIVVTCTTVSFTLGGTVTGLIGSGLVLQNNGAGDQAVSAGATAFAFSNPVTAGAAYNVSVKTQPSNPSQSCTVANATGIATANVLVAVSCVSNTLTIGGTVTGLAGAGLSLLLNGVSPLAINAGASTFVFPSTVAQGSSYTIAIAAHPTNPGQTCSVVNGSGTVGASGVTNAVISCTTNAANTWTVGGSISGLTAPGLVLLNGSASIGVAAGSTAFALPAVASGASYAVTIGAQPSNMTCSVNNGTGTVAAANVVSVAVNCQAATFTVGGTIAGYAGTGLRLLLNGATPRTIAVGATSFVFPAVPAGTAYEVTVGTQPTTPSQSCTVANGTGVVSSANVVNIAITCINVFAVSGTINNQNGTGLVLLMNGASGLTRAPDAGQFSFAGLAPGVPYSVTVGTQPTGPSQTCSVANGSGTIAAANVTNVVVTCVNNGPVVGGSIQGYNGNGLTLRVNGRSPFAPQTNSRFTFPDLFQPGTRFSASIATQPVGQTCTLTGGDGVIQQPPAPNNVQNLVVQCRANATSPLSGTYSVLVGGKRNYLTFWADGTYTYASRLDDANCGNGNGNGVEYGIYNWNATTGAFSILSGAVDSNGSCGMYNSVSQVGASGTLTKTTAAVTLTLPSGTMVLTPVANPSGGYVGSFQSATEQNGAFLVLQPDNTYLVVQTQVNGLAPSGVRLGYERGCFVATGATMTFNLLASCQPDGFPAIDGNGTAGMSDGALGVPIPYVITGPNTLTLDADAFLVRLLVNPLP